MGDEASAAGPPPPPLVFCGPSGVGKGTLIARLLADYPSLFSLCVSHTTRSARPGEVDGVHYHFDTGREDFLARVAAGEFLEHAHVHGNIYGSSFAAVEAVTRSGRACLLDIDVQGASNVKRSPLSAVYVFIAPPSMEELERRLRGRGTETEDKMAKMDEPGFFDAVIVNAELETAYAELKALINRLVVRLPSV